jgi:hypothetical protein
VGDDAGDEFVEGGGGGVLLLLMLFGIEIGVGWTIACVEESYAGEEHGEDGLSSVGFMFCRWCAYK